jgi:outer membrane protein assembly factor BamB
VWRLYGVDAKTGAVLSKPLIPPFEYDEVTGSYHGFNITSGIHALADGTFVALTWHGEMAREELHSIDPATLTHTLIAPIPDVKTLSSQYTDRANSIVYFRGGGSDGVDRFYGVDAKTGAVLSKPLVPPFEYDAATGSYHGFNITSGIHALADGTFVALTWHGEMDREELRTIDPTTLSHTLIAPILDVRTLSSQFTDRANGIVYFRGAGADGVDRLYGVNAKTGAVLSKPLMPPFVYDAVTGSYHGFNFGMGLYFVR